MVAFPQDMKLITDGFRRVRACLTNLITFLNDVYVSWDKRALYDIIYLDFQKALENVPRLRLIPKLLMAHCMSGHLCTWVKDWLTNLHNEL